MGLRASHVKIKFAKESSSSGLQLSYSDKRPHNFGNIDEEALNKLDKLVTSFAKQTVADATKACYVDHNKVSSKTALIKA